MILGIGMGIWPIYLWEMFFLVMLHCTFSFEIDNFLKLEMCFDFHFKNKTGFLWSWKVMDFKKKNPGLKKSWIFFV